MTRQPEQDPIGRYVAALLAAAPPLTDDARARLWTLFGPPVAAAQCPARPVRAVASSPPFTPVEGVPAVFGLVYLGRLRLALSTAEVADLLFGQNDPAALRMVRRLIRSGYLRATSTGRSYVISVQSVVEYLGEAPPRG